MKTTARIFAASCCAVALSLPPLAKANDAVVGALLGAGAGALVGQAFGGRDGAVVGGALGAVVGASSAAQAQPQVVATPAYPGYGYAPVHQPGAVVYSAPVYGYQAPAYGYPAYG